MKLLMKFVFLATIISYCFCLLAFNDAESQHKHKPKKSKKGTHKTVSKKSSESNPSEHKQKKVGALTQKNRIKEAIAKKDDDGETLTKEQNVAGSAKNEVQYAPVKRSPSAKIPQGSGFLFDLMVKNPELHKVLANPALYGVQIIYTQIDRDENNNPHFTSYKYRVDANNYFNPASLVKLPLLIMSLEKFNNLNISGLTKYSPLEIDSAYECQKRVISDSSSTNGKASIAQYIRKILLASDNDAYCRLYEFLGQEYINKTLWSKGYKDVCIINRFAHCCEECNRYTNPFRFYDDNHQLIYQQPLAYNQYEYKNPLGHITEGKSYYDKRTHQTAFVKDYINSNYLSLQTVHDLMLAILFPGAVPVEKRFNLSQADRSFFFKYASMYPRESEMKNYLNTDRYPDNLKKYFMYGVHGKHLNDSSVRVMNVVGQTGGYLSEVAYVVDFKNNIEFILTGVINTDEKRIFLPKFYNYSQIGMPFFEELGKTIYDYELKRNRIIKPDLDLFYYSIYTGNNEK